MDEKALIHFPEGLVGFEDFTRYTLISNPDEEPFFWLQGVDDGDLAFVAVDPLTFESDYDFKVEDETIELLKIEDPADLRLLTIVTMHSDITRMTANLLAPVLINQRNNLGCQLILRDSDYSTKTPMFAQEDDGSEGENP